MLFDIFALIFAAVNLTLGVPMCLIGLKDFFGNGDRLSDSPKEAIIVGLSVLFSGVISSSLLLSMVFF